MSRLPDLLPSALLILGTAGALAIDAASPVPGRTIAAVFPPGIDQVAAMQAVAAGAADWRVVALGLAWPVAVITLVGGSTPAAEFRRASGAWLTIGLPLTGGCLTALPPRTRI